MDDDKEEPKHVERALSMLKQTGIISQIRRIHKLSLRIPIAISAEFSVNATYFHALWSQFKIKNNSVLECLVFLDKIADYVSDSPSEVRERN